MRSARTRTMSCAPAKLASSGSSPAADARPLTRRRFGHANEAGRPALERAVGPPLAVGGREEEHRAAFDERAVLAAEGLALQFLLEPVGEAARVEAVLQRSHAGVVRRGCFIVHGATPSRRPPAAPAW